MVYTGKDECEIDNCKNRINVWYSHMRICHHHHYFRHFRNAPNPSYCTLQEFNEYILLSEQKEIEGE